MVQCKEATSGARCTIIEMRAHNQIFHTDNSLGFSYGIMVNICHKWSHSKCLVKLMMRVSRKNPCIKLVQLHKGVPMWCMERTMPIILNSSGSTKLWNTYHNPGKFFLTYNMVEFVISVHTLQLSWIVVSCSVRQGLYLNQSIIKQAFLCIKA